MKTLFVMRHAKSSWSEPDLKDFSRPLAQRGLDDIPVMASRFLARGCTLDAIVSSPAVRTETTSRLFASAIGLPADRVSSDDSLYFAGAPMLLRAVALFDDDCSKVMLVGHNPAITDFVNELANMTIDNVPTGGIVQFELEIDRWKQISIGSARLVEFYYPKKDVKC